MVENGVCREAIAAFWSATSSPSFFSSIRRIRQRWGHNKTFLFLMFSPASLMFVSCSFRSSFTLSIHFFGCLPLLLVLYSCPYNATAGSLLSSIPVRCQKLVSLTCLFFVHQCNPLSLFWSPR